MSGINQYIIAETVGGRLAYHVGGFFALKKKLPNLKTLSRGRCSSWFYWGLSDMTPGMSGAILTVDCSLCDWTGEQSRALVQPFNKIVLGTVMIFMAWRGLLAPHIWLTVATAFPFSITGQQIDIFAFWRLSDHHFQRLLIWMIFL